MSTTQLSIHELGPVHPNTKGCATFETKPTTYLADGTRDTGGGYEHWRSNEYRPHTARQGKEDVYVSHHRLLSVVACYPDDMAVGDILDDLHGKDVHHTTGVPWCNFGESPNFDADDLPFATDDDTETGLEVLGHGTHSEITNAQMRAWAEDSKDQAAESVTTTDDCVCANCGDDSETFVEGEDWEGQVCPECSQSLHDGDPDVERVHLPSESVHRYCPDHAPDVDGETWGESDGD